MCCTRQKGVCYDGESISRSYCREWITYHLAEDGCYYLQLSREQKTDYVIGKNGIICGEYMMTC